MREAVRKWTDVGGREGGYGKGKFDIRGGGSRKEIGGIPPPITSRRNFERSGPCDMWRPIREPEVNQKPVQCSAR